MNGRLANARAITKQLLCDNFRPEIAMDVTSGVDVEHGGMNVHLEFGDFYVKPFSRYTTASLCYEQRRRRTPAIT